MTHLNIGLDMHQSIYLVDDNVVFCKVYIQKFSLRTCLNWI